MIWLTWRQHRTESMISGGLFALLAALLVLSGLQMLDAYHSLNIAACLGSNGSSQHCQDNITAFFNAAGSLPNLIGWANFLPLILGVLLAAPLPLEIEHGTYRLAWTQSVTRSRWITVKLGLIAVGAALVGVALSLLFSWWRVPLDHLDGTLQPNTSFDFQGIVPIGYVLFAAALVAAAGTALRRAIPAVGLSLVVFLVTRVGIQTFVRPSLMMPLRKVTPASADPSISSTVGRQAWVLGSGFSDRAGHVIPDQRAFAIIETCKAHAPNLAKGSNAMQVMLKRCLDSHHIYNLVIYQPSSRFWSLQALEFGMYVAASLVLFGFTIWWVRSRIG